jgi:hypothetical protein
MDSTRKTAREWLLENGYPEIAKMIDDIQAEWKIAGKHTRRNWWEVLAGGKNGQPRIIYGRRFPVLQAAQTRQGKPCTNNAIKEPEEDSAPAVFNSGRWKKGIEK